MKTNSYKYIVLRETSLWDNIKNKLIPQKDNDESTEFSGNSLLVERRKALEKAKSLMRFFEDKEQQTEFPPVNWDIFCEKKGNIWILYDIKVLLVGEENSYCIFSTAGVNGEDWTNSFVFEDLLKEYEIFEKLKIDVSQFKKSVTYFDNKDKEKKSAYILLNGMNWGNAEINYLAKIDDLQL